jgi:hypothetical protein
MDTRCETSYASSDTSGNEIRDTPRHLIQLALIEIARAVMLCGRGSGGSERKRRLNNFIFHYCHHGLALQPRK